MARTTPVLTRYPKQLLNEVDRLVRGGTYASRSDALRDSVRVMIRSQRGVAKDVNPGKTGLELQKEGNRRYREHYLKLAKGNEKEAWALMLKDLKKVKV
jgi:Arc/MetJ-type ribon-helix-helix transcriptional regulator